MSVFNQDGSLQQAEAQFSQQMYGQGLQGHRGLRQQWQESQIQQKHIDRDREKFAAIFRQFQPPTHMPYAGNRYIVICNGAVTELPADASVDAAEEKAAELATSTQCPAFVLKPIKKVAPKRETVTTDL